MRKYERNQIFYPKLCNVDRIILRDQFIDILFYSLSVLFSDNNCYICLIRLLLEKYKDNWAQ